jgi:hypothetical protein
MNKPPSLGRQSFVYGDRGIPLERFVHIEVAEGLRGILHPRIPLLEVYNCSDCRLRRVINRLCCCSTALGFEPDFLYPLENVTIAQGRDAMFTCVVNNLGGYRVSADLAPARVRALPSYLSHSFHYHSPLALSISVFLFLCL